MMGGFADRIDSGKNGQLEKIGILGRKTDWEEHHRFLPTSDDSRRVAGFDPLRALASSSIESLDAGNHSVFGRQHDRLEKCVLR